jgi:hypothetical protein
VSHEGLDRLHVEAMQLKAAQAATNWTRAGTNGFLGFRKRAGTRQSIAGSLDPDECVVRLRADAT